MVQPAIVWRNPRFMRRRRLWNQARSESNRRLYIVVRSSPEDGAWEGLPNLEVIEGGGARANKSQVRSTLSTA